MNVRTFYRKLEGKVVARHRIEERQVSRLSECLRWCLRGVMCQAFSLDDNGHCVTSFSADDADTEDTDDGRGSTYLNTAN